MRDCYRYAAVFTEEDGFVAVAFPDLPGCYTCGDDLKQALQMAREALVLHLHGMLADGEAVPAPTSPAVCMANQMVRWVEVWLPLASTSAGAIVEHDKTES